MRLIDADELKSIFTEKSTENVCGAELCKAIISRIYDAPTVDAVPISFIEEMKAWAEENGFVGYVNDLIHLLLSWEDREEE